MPEIIIDKEFQELLPTLDPETFRLLEENIMQNGCRDALVVWNNILVDGYNRYSICKKHDIPFIVTEKSFDSRENVLIWIISNQVARRNLTPIQLSHFRGLHYKADKKIQGTNNRFAQKSKNRHSDGFYSTSKHLAEQYHVSQKTIERDARTAAAITAIGEISPEAKRKILSGEIPVDKKKLQTLSAEPKELIEKIAASIETGAYEKEKAAVNAPPEHGTPAELILSEMKVLNAVIRNGDITELKTALKLCIDNLKGLYKRM